MLPLIAKYRLYIISGLLLLSFLLFEAELVRQSPRLARGPLAAISLHNAQRMVFVVGNRLACQEEASAAHGSSVLAILYSFFNCYFLPISTEFL